MSDRSPGELLAEARKSLGWSQAKLAEALGFSTVLVSKIESGVRVPSEAFIQALSSRLPDKAEALRDATESKVQPDGRKAGGLKIVDAMQLARKNGERGARLKARAERTKLDADAVAQQLDESVKEFDHDVIDPFSRLAGRIIDLPEDVIAHASVLTTREDPEFADALNASQVKTSKSIFALLGAGVLGGGTGAAVGAGAATATYLTVASIATASTGAAISGLSGAAASSATLAAIGGGSLAAGGLGIAGGTAVLTGIVAFPIVAVVAGALLVSGGRILDKQKQVESELEQAEKHLDANEAVVRVFVARAGRINEILTVALLASRNYLRGIERDLPADGDVKWSEIEPATQGSIHRVAEIVLAGLTVLALPIGMNLKHDAATVVVGGDDGNAIPRMALGLEPGDDVQNQFIDFAIEQAFNQVAR